jgi:hypothetical protein
MTDLTDDDRTTPLGLFHTARSYWRSAEHLSAASLRVTHPEAPVTFLYCHAIELYLKAYLRAAGKSVADLKRIRHRVARLAEAAVADGLQLDPQNAEILLHIEDWDVAMEARYIRTGFSSQLSSDAFAGVAEHLDQRVEGFLQGKGLPVLRQHFDPPVPSSGASEARPLRFVLEERQTFCGPARAGDRPGTQLAAHWHVTNASDARVVLLRARVHGQQAAFSHVATRHFRGDQFSVQYPLLPGRMTEVTASFFFFPPIHSEGECFVADIIFTDNYENEHPVKAVQFRSIEGDSNLTGC